MKHLSKPAALICLLLLSVSLTGCVKFKQIMTVMPDGSGKMTLNVGMSNELILIAKQQGQDPFKEMMPTALNEDFTGVVAFTKPVQKKEQGYTFLAFTAYFQDINDVRLGSPDKSAKPATFTYAKQGELATLTVQHSMVLSAIVEHRPVEDEDKAEAAAVTNGLVFTEVYNLPGKVEAIKGLTTAGQTATLEMTQAHMLNSNGPIEDLKGIDKLTFKISGIKEDDAAMKAFQAELEKAKQAWDAMKKEAQVAE